MKIKEKKQYKNERIIFRLKEDEKNMLRVRALLYAEGNLSAYLRHAVLNYMPLKSDLKGD